MKTSRKLLKEFGKIKIALIATYPNMSQVFEDIIKDTEIEMIDIQAPMEEAVKKAKEIEDSVDIILTRGGTGHFLKKTANIPVIIIPISPFDLYKACLELPKKAKKVGFANYNRPLLNIDWIEKALNKKILQYQFTDWTDLNLTPHWALKDKCDSFVGGQVAVSVARDLGLAASVAAVSEETAYQTLAEAMEVVTNNRKEKRRAAIYKAGFDALSEGICVTDGNEKVLAFNPAAANIFNVPEKEVIGQRIRDTRLGKYVDSKDTQDQSLIRIRDHVLSKTDYPIELENENIGNISTFVDVTKIQKLEGQIRNQLSQKGFVAKYTFDDILTCNQTMIDCKNMARLYASTDSAVLIQGESGTGKELFAHAIHNASQRSTGPFVSVNCAAISENLLESELFGYASGAFTGALKEGKIGYFEMANNGTIFLDEIGEMPISLQTRLLRILQEKEIMRVGGNKLIPVNCRIISATNKNLLEMVRNKEFREDLYYRLNVLTVSVPPLRERPEDIGVLCDYFFSTIDNLDMSPSFRRTTHSVFNKMKDTKWMGNVRELHNVCEKIAVVSRMADSSNIQKYIEAMFDEGGTGGTGYITLQVDGSLSLKEMVEEAQTQYIDAVLKQNGNNQSKTAKQLQIGRTTLWRRTGAKS